MKRLRLSLAVCIGIAAAVPAVASAQPAQPPGCSTVLGTPAVATGSPMGMAQKEAAYFRVCLS
jgi:hypothetical protein